MEVRPGRSRPMLPGASVPTLYPARPPGGAFSEGRGMPVPSVESLREMYCALWGFAGRGSGKSHPAIAQESEYLPYVGRVVDTLEPIRPLLGRFQGWPVLTDRSVGYLTGAFDATIKRWGWERIAVPEPERSAAVINADELFFQEVSRPLMAAALAIVKGTEGLAMPYPYVVGWAEDGRRCGVEPMGDLEAAHAAYQELRGRWCNGLRYGRAYPEIDELRDAAGGATEWNRALNHLSAAVGRAEPNHALRPWRPLEPCSRIGMELPAFDAERSLIAIAEYREILQELWDRLAFTAQHGKPPNRPWPDHLQRSQSIRSNMRAALPVALCRFGDGQATAAVRWWCESFSPNTIPTGLDIPAHAFWTAREMIEGRLDAAESTIQALAEKLGAPEAPSEPPPAGDTPPSPQGGHEERDLDALANNLGSAGHRLEAAFVRAFIGRSSISANELIEVVCTDPAEGRSWGTIKTWKTRTENAIRDIDVTSRVRFCTSARDGGRVFLKITAG